MSGPVVIDREQCTGCGVCVRLCPKRILVLDKEDRCVVTDQQACDRLGGCERACPADAIHIR